MATKKSSSPMTKEQLEKKIAEHNQFQWLALMPAWLPGVLGSVNRTPTVPGREIYVLLFRVGMIVLGLVAFATMRLQIKKMKAQLARLENPSADDAGSVAKPPIPDPLRS